MPSFNFDPTFRGDWLDVMLHDPTHPVWLVAPHLRAGDNVVVVLGIGSLPTTSRQFFDQHVIQWDALFRSFRFETFATVPVNSVCNAVKPLSNGDP